MRRHLVVVYGDYPISTLSLISRSMIQWTNRPVPVATKTGGPLGPADLEAEAPALSPKHVLGSMRRP